MAAPPRTAQVGCLGRLPIRHRCATCPGAMCPAAPSTASTDKSGSSRRRPRPASPAPRDGNWDSALVLDQPCSPTRGHHAEPSRSLTGSTALIASTPTPAPTSSRANVEKILVGATATRNWRHVDSPSDAHSPTPPDSGRVRRQEHRATNGSSRIVRWQTVKPSTRRSSTVGRCATAPATAPRNAPAQRSSAALTSWSLVG